MPATNWKQYIPAMVAGFAGAMDPRSAPQLAQQGWNAQNMRLQQLKMKQQQEREEFDQKMAIESGQRQQQLLDIKKRKYEDEQEQFKLEGDAETYMRGAIASLANTRNVGGLRGKYPQIIKKILDETPEELKRHVTPEKLHDIFGHTFPKPVTVDKGKAVYSYAETPAGLQAYATYSKSGEVVALGVNLPEEILDGLADNPGRVKALQDGYRKSGDLFEDPSDKALHYKFAERLPELVREAQKPRGGAGGGLPAQSYQQQLALYAKKQNISIEQAAQEYTMMDHQAEWVNLNPQMVIERMQRQYAPRTIQEQTMIAHMPELQLGKYRSFLDSLKYRNPRFVRRHMGEAIPAVGSVLRLPGMVQSKMSAMYADLKRDGNPDFHIIDRLIELLEFEYAELIAKKKK